MKWKISSILSALAMVMAFTFAPLSVAFADDSDDLDVSSFDVLSDSDSEEGSIELIDSDDSDDTDVDSEDSDGADSDDSDGDSEDSDGGLDDDDSEDDSDEDSDESEPGSDEG